MIVAKYSITTVHDTILKNDVTVNDRGTTDEYICCGGGGGEKCIQGLYTTKKNKPLWKCSSKSSVRSDQIRSFSTLLPSFL